MKNAFTIFLAIYNYRSDEMAEAGSTMPEPWIVKWKRVRPVADIEEEQPFFEEEHMYAIVNAASNKRARAMYALFGGTGMRFGEAAALLVEDVHFVNDGTGVVTMRRSLSGDEICTTKANRVRHVPIDKVWLRNLRSMWTIVVQIFFSRVAAARRFVKATCFGLLDTALGKLQIPRAGFHAFRHGRCSFLVRTDVPRSVIRDWLGHSSDKMIDLYSHRWGKHSKLEMQKLVPLMDSRNGLKQLGRLHNDRNRLIL